MLLFRWLAAPLRFLMLWELSVELAQHGERAKKAGESGKHEVAQTRRVFFGQHKG